MTENNTLCCDHCEQVLGLRYTAIERRIDQVRMLSEDDFEDGAPNWDPDVDDDWLDEDEGPDLIEGIEPLDAEEVASYCDRMCWAAAEAGWIERLQLQDPYPEEGVMVPCSRCGAMIDRTRPHVSYNVTDGEFITDADGYERLMIHEATCLAILCNTCEAAEFSEEETDEPQSVGTVAYSVGG